MHPLAQSSISKEGRACGSGLAFSSLVLKRDLFAPL